MRSLVLAASLALSCVQAQTPSTDLETVVESSLLAPCCWQQTLDVHESPMATALREEVRARLRAGEGPQAIEDDFAARFGERVRAVPRGRDPKLALGVASLAMLALVGLALVLLVLRRWTRVAGLDSEGVTEASALRSDSYDDRIDEELKALDRA